MDIELKSLINEKKTILENASKNLKTYFVGLDDIIDKIIKNIEAWYVFPDLITRPVIISLWGLTGVGKTDLVRKLVKELKLTDKFVEIQFEESDDEPHRHGDTKYVENILKFSGIEEGSPGILLLDEIQRFRTIDKMGKDYKNSKYGDIWMLLSDGTFNTEGADKKKIIEFLLEMLYDDDAFEDVDEQPTKINNSKKVKKYQTDVWNSRQMKDILKLPNTIEEIMKWNLATKIDIIQKRMTEIDFSKGCDFSKLLIFISGNLDEAYEMANRVDDAEIDADALHQFSKNINIIDIKSALKKRFKPEQISRFGNMHVIYPSLDRKCFEKLIQRKLDEIVVKIYDKCKIQINIDKSINEVLYRNGVFPAQGVRPLFSTISGVFEASLPTMVLNAMENELETITISTNEEKLISTSNGNTFELKIDLVLDSIRAKLKFNKHRNTLISIHEAGHALIYALLFKTVPIQIKSCCISYADGYTFVHNMIPSKNMILNKIRLAFGGICAEEATFGTEMVTDGSKSDIRHATHLAGSYIRKFSMSKYVSFINDSAQDIGDECVEVNTDVEKTNKDIEELLVDLRNNTLELIKSNMKELYALNDILSNKGEITAEEFIKIFEHKIKLQQLDPKETLIEPYNEIIKSYN